MDPVNQSTRTESNAVKFLAPEDIAVGDYVAVLSVRVDFPSFFWTCSESLKANELVSIESQAGASAIPWKVKSICLPFLLVKGPDGQPATLDVRRQRLARLSRSFARKVRKALRETKPTS